MHRTITERILRLLNSGLVYCPAGVTLDRVMDFTESVRETNQDLIVLRWAKALKHFSESIPVAVSQSCLRRQSRTAANCKQVNLRWAVSLTPGIRVACFSSKRRTVS